jgi:hypothetical protein
VEEDERDFCEKSWGRELAKLVHNPRAHDVDVDFMIKELATQICLLLAYKE